jgi:acyl-CoA thioesterase I
MIFIRDSITASSKNMDSDRLGSGYVRLIKKEISDHIKVINKGVNGQRVTDLAFRWKRDVLDLEPDLVSISIGINDVWRLLDSLGLNQVDVQKFEHVYRELLSQLTSRNPVKAVLMEPTIIDENPDSKGNQMLISFVEVVRKLAKEFGAILVPTHQVFIDHIKSHPNTTLTTDGVHMNELGNQLMAVTWLEVVREHIAI